MQKILAFIMCMTIHFFVFAQDDFPDYRNKRESFSKLTDKALRSDLATFTLAGIDESIGKLPLKTVPITAVENNFIRFSNDTLQIVIQSTGFDLSKHKLNYYEEHLVKIDNKPYYGNYGSLPTHAIKEIKIIYRNKDTLVLPSTAYADLYNPQFAFSDYAEGTLKSHNAVYLSGNNIYIYMLNLDAGEKGSYEVTWIVQNHKYLRRVLDFDMIQR